MAVLAGKNHAGAGFGNARELCKAVYDFSVDTGAQADYEVFEADTACVVHLKQAYVETAATSSDAAVLDLGKSAGGTEMWSDKAVAVLTAGSVHVGDLPVYLAAGDKIILGIEAFDLLTGKINFIFEVYKY
jgi:hypothetical protein